MRHAIGGTDPAGRRMLRKVGGWFFHLGRAVGSCVVSLPPEVVHPAVSGQTDGVSR